MSTIDELVQNAEAYASAFEKRDLGAAPVRKVAVVACMDARLDVSALLGLDVGDAHVIRNAGGVVTDDEIRSLAVSQRLGGTEEIMVIHHTDCAMHMVGDEHLRRELEAETGAKPEWRVETFGDPDADVRESVARIKASPFIPKKHAVRGFVYEVEAGRLREVD